MLRKIHFLNQLLEKHHIGSLYKTLTYHFNNTVCYQNPNESFEDTTVDSLGEVHIAYPKFLVPEFYNSPYKVKTITQKYQDCYGIIIPPNTKNISDYLADNYKSNYRYKILKSVKLLESCFNISYKMFFGSMTPETYEQIMSCAKYMLIRRFKQRNDNHFILNQWDAYNKLLYPLILEKKASIFVIYNQNTPIQVYINFHYKNIFFAYTPSYNIDYAKFGLGNTAVYKQLEWCIEHGYEYLDMGNGDYDYKKRWCNHHYMLETHVFYNQNSLKANILATAELLKIKTKNTLKDVINSGFYKKLKTLTKRQSSESVAIYSNYSTQQVLLDDIDLSSNFEPVTYTINESFNPIDKPLFDFLYNNKVHFNTIKIYKLTSSNNIFLITSNQTALQVTFNPA